MAEFYVYNQQKERIGMLEQWDSVQWLEHYQDVGEIKIVAQATDNNMELLSEGNRIFNTDRNTFGIVVHREVDENNADRLLTVRGQLSASLLDQRVVMATETITNAEAGMLSVVSKNIRGLPITIDAAQGFTEILNLEITWNSILDGIKEIAAGSGLGFVLKADPDSGAEIFSVYKTVDRSSDTSTDYIGYFGTDMDNLARINIRAGMENYKNVAVVAGAGSGAARVVRIVSIGNVQGEARREMYVDARHLQKDYQIATPTGETDPYGNPVYDYTQGSYTDAEYNALLDAWGLEKLAEQTRELQIECEVLQNNIYLAYPGGNRTDQYFLGDRMPIKLYRYGLFGSAIISSIDLVYEQTGIRTLINFSNFILEGLT